MGMGPIRVDRRAEGRTRRGEMVSALGQGAYDRLQSCLASTVRIAAEKNKLEARTHRYFKNVRQAAGRAGGGGRVWRRLGGRRRQDAGAEVFQVQDRKSTGLNSSN